MSWPYLPTVEMLAADANDRPQAPPKQTGGTRSTSRTAARAPGGVFTALQLIEEVDQCRVELISMGDIDPVGATLDHVKSAALNRRVRPLARCLEGDSLIAVAVDHEEWHSQLGQVSSEIGPPDPDGFDERRVLGLFGDGQCLGQLGLGDLESVYRGGEEGCHETLDEAVSICAALVLQAGETGSGHGSVRVVVSNHQRRSDGGCQYCAGEPILTVSADVSGDFATTHGESNDHGIAQVQRVHECGKVRREGVVVVSGLGFTGLTETASVVGDGTKTMFFQRRDGSSPSCTRQRPTVDQDHRTSVSSGILVVQRDRGSAGDC